MSFPLLKTNGLLKLISFSYTSNKRIIKGNVIFLVKTNRFLKSIDISLLLLKTNG